MDTVAIRFAAVGRHVFQDIIVPNDDLTVGGALNVLRERGVDYNGQEVQMYWNGAACTEETPVSAGGQLILVPDKPTGN